MKRITSFTRSQLAGVLYTLPTKNTQHCGSLSNNIWHNVWFLLLVVSFKTFLLLFILNSIWGCKHIDTGFAGNCEQCNFVGATYAVFNANKILEKGSYGLRCINCDTAQIQLTDRFHIASNTKAVTALLAAKLVEEKKINWNTKFFDVLPDLISQCLPNYWNITLQDLLCHRAHIQPYLILDSANAIYNLTGDNITAQRKEFCVQVLNQPPAYSDTSVYVYSNAGVVLAAAMLEKVSGKTWEQMVKDYLNTGLAIPFQMGFPNEHNLHQPYGHSLRNGTIIAFNPGSFKIAPVIRPAGGLNIDLPDYVHFIQLFMKGYNGKNNFITSANYKYMLTAMPAYSFGWMRKTIDGKDICYHYGNSGIFCSCVEYDLKDNLAAIVLVNYSDENAVNEIESITHKLIMQQLQKRVL